MPSAVPLHSAVEAWELSVAGRNPMDAACRPLALTKVVRTTGLRSQLQVLREPVLFFYYVCVCVCARACVHRDSCEEM